MADAMVVARMTQEKKESVARRLSDMGTNASSVINQLYDYIERTGMLPFEDGLQEENRDQRALSARQWLAELDRLPEGNVFQSSSDDEIAAARLDARRAKWESAQ